MNKKLIIGLIISLAIVVLVYIFIKEKNKKKLQASTLLNNNTVAPVVPITTPTTATPPYSGGGGYTAPTVPQNNQGTTFPIVVGSTGIIVKIVQAALGLKVDGVYGAKTDIAVKAANVDLSTAQKFIDKFISTTTEQYKANFPLKKGSKNNYVKAVQILLGLTPDGVFGAGTEKAVKDATGKIQLFHSDFTAMFQVLTGQQMAYNSKPIKNETLEKLKQGMAGIWQGVFPTSAAIYSIIK